MTGCTASLTNWPFSYVPYNIIMACILESFCLSIRQKVMILIHALTRLGIIRLSYTRTVDRYGCLSSKLPTFYAWFSRSNGIFGFAQLPNYFLTVVVGN